MAGDANVVEKLKSGYQAIGRTYKNHIDGYNLVPYLTGEAKNSPRNFFMYLSDDGDVMGMRYDNWKIAFMEQRCHGTLQVWAEPFTRLRISRSIIFTPIRSSARTRPRTLTGTVRRPHPDDLRRAGGGDAMGGDLQGFPAHPEAQHLHARSGLDSDARDRRRNALSVGRGAGRRGGLAAEST